MRNLIEKKQGGCSKHLFIQISKHLLHGCAMNCIQTFTGCLHPFKTFTAVIQNIYCSRVQTLAATAAGVQTRIENRERTEHRVVDSTEWVVWRKGTQETDMKRKEKVLACGLSSSGLPLLLSHPWAACSLPGWPHPPCKQQHLASNTCVAACPVPGGCPSSTCGRH